MTRLMQLVISLQWSSSFARTISANLPAPLPSPSELSYHPPSAVRRFPWLCQLEIHIPFLHIIIAREFRRVISSRVCWLNERLHCFKVEAAVTWLKRHASTVSLHKGTKDSTLNSLLLHKTFITFRKLEMNEKKCFFLFFQQQQQQQSQQQAQQQAQQQQVNSPGNGNANKGSPSPANSSSPGAVASTNNKSLSEPKPVECNLCHRKFKNIPALNGHMRLHGGYYRKVRPTSLNPLEERNGKKTKSRNFREK